MRKSFSRAYLYISTIDASSTFMMGISLNIHITFDFIFLFRNTPYRMRVACKSFSITRANFHMYCDAGNIVYIGIFANHKRIWEWFYEGLQFIARYLYIDKKNWILIIKKSAIGKYSSGFHSPDMALDMWQKLQSSYVNLQGF